MDEENDEKIEEVFGVTEVEYDSVSFEVGEKVSSYKQLEKITAYQDGNNIQLVYTDSRMLLEREHPRGSRKQIINYITTLYTLHVTSVESNFKAKDLFREHITGVCNCWNFYTYLIFLNVQYH